MDVAWRFGENLRSVRKQAGISQEALGFRAGLHRTEVGLLERGARIPRIDTLMKLACALGVRVDCPLLDGIAWSSGEVRTTPGRFSFAAVGRGGDPADEARAE
jgi:transcriptional regulator with XRE-family HTH domain